MNPAYLAVLVAVLGVQLALAQTPSAHGTTADLHPLWVIVQPYFEMLAYSVVSAALAWAAVQFQRLTGHQVELKHMQALDAAAKTGLGKFFAKVGDQPMTVDVRRAAIAEAIEWMEQSVPDALSATGLDSPVRRDKLGEYVEGKLGQMLLGSGTSTEAPK